jgi:predicted secreted hydrolase
MDFSYPQKPMQLPRDLAAHEWAQTEWWYYTGHLKSADGKKYGFELTFFRRRMDNDSFHGMKFGEVVQNAYMSHFSVTEESTGKFIRQGLASPEGPMASALSDQYQVRIGPWQASGDDRVHRIKAAHPEMAIDLELQPLKPAVLHGNNGIVAKGNNMANYYMSYTRLQVSGKLVFEGREMEVTGLGWFDHEYGFMGATPDTGWDWYSIQLDDNTEYMIYAIRRPDKTIEPLSKACKIDQQSKEQCVPVAQAKITPVSSWKSPLTRASYPSGWQIAVPELGLEVKVSPDAPDQEFLFLDIAYWEGSCSVEGRPANGMAYVELVGYSRSEIMNMTNPEKEKALGKQKLP